MGVYQKLVNYDKLFHSHRRFNPVIINDREEITEDDKEKFNRLIYTRFEPSDLLSNLPACSCTKIVGEFNVGVICEECGTPVVSAMEQNLEPLVWMRAPHGVKGLINPMVWTMLTKRFMSQGFDVIRWMCDANFTPTVQFPRVLPKIQDMGIQRGLNFFIDNFDKIMDALFAMREYRPKKGQEDALPQLLRENRDCIFPQYMPVPNRSLLVIEKTNVGIYADPIVTGVVDAIRTMVGIDTDLCTYSVRTKENRTARTINQLATFYDGAGGIYRSFLATKEGVCRKHLYGTRAHWSFRAVISSLTGRHRYDELRVPWGIGIELMRVHLMNKLLRMDFTANEASAFLYQHAEKFHPMINELFKTLIREAGPKGIHVIFTRNPTLARGSCQGMYISQFKEDVNDPTIGLPILAVTGFNADFDGDQMSGMMSLDKQTEEALEALAPHKSAFDLDKPKELSRNLSMPKPVVATLANFIDAEAENDPDKETLMLELLAA